MSTLYGWTWYGDETPSVDIMPGQKWFKTTGERYQRNKDNTNWIFKGYVDKRLGGSIERSGSIIEGNIDGLTAYNPPLTNPNMTGIKQGGISVSIEKDISAMEKRVYDKVLSNIASLSESNYKNQSILSNVAYYSSFETTNAADIITDGVAIAPPVFSDGVSATNDQILGYGWGITNHEFKIQDLGSGFLFGFYLYEASERLIKGTWTASTNPYPDPESVRFTMMTWAFAVR